MKTAIGVDVPLFDMPEPAPGEPVRGRWRDLGLTERARMRITLGLHPLECVATGLRLHPAASLDPENHIDGPRCGTCLFNVRVTWHNRTYHKCGIGSRSGPGSLDKHATRASHSEQTDVRQWWPACTNHSPSTNPTEGEPR